MLDGSVALTLSETGREAVVFSLSSQQARRLAEMLVATEDPGQEVTGDGAMRSSICMHEDGLFEINQRSSVGAVTASVFVTNEQLQLMAADAKASTLLRKFGFVQGSDELRIDAATLLSLTDQHPEGFSIHELIIAHGWDGVDNTWALARQLRERGYIHIVTRRGGQRLRAWRLGSRASV